MPHHASPSKPPKAPIFIEQISKDAPACGNHQAACDRMNNITPPPAPSGGSVFTNLCCVARHCSNPQDRILNSSGEPKVFTKTPNMSGWILWGGGLRIN